MIGKRQIFIRFAGCNINCKYCDTENSKSGDIGEYYSIDELNDIVQSLMTPDFDSLEITGGEPLIHTDVKNLLTELAKIVEVHVETNGSVDISEYRVSEKVHFVVDYKLPESGMENTMCLKNLANVNKNDAYKFVISSESDAYKALQIIKENNLINQKNSSF